MTDDPLKRYKELKRETDDLWPLVVSEVCRRYEAGDTVAVLAEDSGANVLTVYRWLHSQNVEVRGKGRKRASNVDRFAEPIHVEPTFAWVTDRDVKVTMADQTTVIDVDRINWTGNAALGQNLVSGKNPDLLAKFERFVNENH